VALRGLRALGKIAWWRGRRRAKPGDFRKNVTDEHFPNPVGFGKVSDHKKTFKIVIRGKNLHALVLKLKIGKPQKPAGIFGVFLSE
jgi:hypothetical protein